MHRLVQEMVQETELRWAGRRPKASAAATDARATMLVVAVEEVEEVATELAGSPAEHRSRQEAQSASQSTHCSRSESRCDPRARSRLPLTAFQLLTFSSIRQCPAEALGPDDRDARWARDDTRACCSLRSHATRSADARRGTSRTQPPNRQPPSAPASTDIGAASRSHAALARSHRALQETSAMGWSCDLQASVSRRAGRARIPLGSRRRRLRVPAVRRRSSCTWSRRSPRQRSRIQCRPRRAP